MASDPMTFLIDDLPARERLLLERVMRLCNGEPCGRVRSVAMLLLLDVILSESRDLDQIDHAIEVMAIALRDGARSNLAAAAAEPMTMQ